MIVGAAAARPPGGPGRPPVHPRRRIVEAILYVDRTGCAWRYLPSEYPPWRTVYGCFAAWRADGTLDRLHDALREQVRAAAGRSASPARRSSTPSRSAPPTPSRDPAGAGITPRRSTAASATSPSIPSGCCWRSWSPPHPCRTATAPARCCGSCAPRLPRHPPGLGRRRIHRQAHRLGRRRAPGHRGRAQARRRTPSRSCPAAGSWNEPCAWISTHRRCVRDYERLPASHEAMVLWAMIALMTQRLAQTPRPE